MINFIYNTPTKIFFGRDEELAIGKIINEYKFKRVLLHYGKSSIKKSGLYDKLKQLLTDAGIEVFELGGVEPNPKITLVRKGVKIVKTHKIELILAVGGGSVIDSSKLISVGSCVDFDPWLFSAHQEIPNNHIPVGVILTLSASGSAMSNSCVITNQEFGLKRGFNSEHNRPLFAILNPELTYSVSPFQTACGVVDIMMHTLERYLTNESFDISDNLALALLKSVKDAGIVAYHNPTSYSSRATLMWAESLSHNGLTGSGNKYVMLVHQLEHEVSGMYDRVAHAEGLSALFIGYCKIIYPQALEKFQRLGEVLFEVKEQDLNKAASKTIEEFEKFFQVLSMPTTITQLGITDQDIEQMALILSNNKQKVIKGIIDLDYQTAKEIYQNCK